MQNITIQFSVNFVLIVVQAVFTKSAVSAIRIA